MLCCAHCSLAMESHKINVSGKHGRVYGNWVLPFVCEEDKEFLKTLFGKDVYAKYDSLNNSTIKFQKETYLKKKIALLVLQKISDISSSEDMRLKLGITAPCIFNSESLYADDLPGEDVLKINEKLQV